MHSHFPASELPSLCVKTIHEFSAESSIINILPECLLYFLWPARLLLPGTPHVHTPLLLRVSYLALTLFYTIRHVLPCVKASSMVLKSSVLLSASNGVSVVSAPHSSRSTAAVQIARRRRQHSSSSPTNDKRSSAFLKSSSEALLLSLLVYSWKQVHVRALLHGSPETVKRQTKPIYKSSHCFYCWCIAESKCMLQRSCMDFTWEDTLFIVSLLPLISHAVNENT